MLPPEIIYKILSFPFLDIYDKENFLLSVYPNYLDIIKKEKINLINKFYSPIREALGGVNKMLNIPLLKFKTSFMEIDYIDSIKIQDVTHPLMIGIDNWRRPFCSILYKFKNKYHLEVIFQRFTDEMSTWTCGTSYSKRISPYGYFIDKGKIDNITIDKIKNIIQNNYILDYN